MLIPQYWLKQLSTPTASLSLAAEQGMTQCSLQHRRIEFQQPLQPRLLGTTMDKCVAMTTIITFVLLKVHDVYTTSSPLYLLFATTDRISTFDVILKFGIPEKGKLLMKILLYWFEKFGSVISGHFIMVDVD